MGFASLEAELAAITEYKASEGLEDDNSWPIYLSGAAYEHWGRPRLASAQFDLLRHSKGIRLIPELWCRKAYNAFKVGDISYAERYHEIASLIRAEAVGNQMHFSFWFENTFKDFKPRPNGPPYFLQSAICKYCTGKFKKAYQVIRPSLVAGSCGPRGMVLAALWLLAISARLNETANVDGLPEADVAMARDAISAAGVVDDDLKPIVELFFNPGSQVAGPGVEDGDVFQIRAGFMALFNDSIARDEQKQKVWFDSVDVCRAPDCTHDDVDFMYWATKHRFLAPEGLDGDLPPAQVPM